MKESFGVDTPGYKKFEQIERNTTRMMKILDHLRDFSRVSELESVPIDINTVLECSFMLLEAQLQHKDIIIEKHLENGLPQIMGDHIKLEQVFLNLIINARDAMCSNDSKNERKLTITTQRGHNQVVMLFSDTGVGIPDKAKQKIFDPFFTTKEVGKGTGLGLAISHGIMEDHGGKIELVESRENEGTTFKLTFNKLKI